MKFSCNQKNFSAAISNVQRAVSNKSTTPEMEGILIKAENDKITLCGYDTEIGIVTSIKCNIQEEGGIIINAKLLCDIVKRLPDENVNIQTDEKFIVNITSGQADYKIIGMSPETYPELPIIDKTDTISIKSSLLKNMIKQTVFAVSTEISRPVYTGSLFEINEDEFKIVSIDGYRMAIRKEKIQRSNKNSFVVPGKTLNEILKLISDEEEDTKIEVGQRHAALIIEDYKIITRLIEGNFIDYKTTVPSNYKTEIKINTRNLISAVERMSLLTSEKIQSPIRCTVDSNKIKLSCSTAIGKANDAVYAEINGENVEIGLNNKYLLDALRNTETDEVKIQMNGSLTPIKIMPIDGDSFLFLVVPMRFKQ